MSEMMVGGVGGADAVSSRGFGEATALAAATPGESLIPPPEVRMFDIPSGDVGAELAKLVLEGSHQDKKLGREIRNSAEQTQLAAEKAQLEAMKDKADANYWSGIVSGASTAVSAGSGLLAAGASEGGGKRWSAAGKASEGAGQIISAVYKHDAEMSDLRVTEQEQLGSHHKRTGEDARDSVRDAKDLIDRALGFYKEYNAAKADAQKAVFLRA